MAESLAEPFVSFVVERLGGLLIAEAKFLRGVKVQVEQLQTELRRMRCFLKDADARREDGDESVRNWVAEIREVAYDAEDAIEAFVIEVAFTKATGGIFNTLVRCSCIVVPDCRALHKIGMEIESIKTKISSISASLQNHGVRSTPEGEISSSRYERQRLLRQTYAHIMEEDIVGLDGDLRIVVDHLVNEDRGCRVVSIWGMAGIGKTTLAKKVYHHNDVKRNFDCRVWVYISQQCNPRELLEQILTGLGTSTSRVEIKAMTPAELVTKIYEVQSEKKCLVILDDVWDTQTWDLLVPAFPINNSNKFGSKILITTRNGNVASCPDGQHCFVRELRLLNEVESWELFQKKASLSRFVTGTELSAKMAEQGKEMVKHCSGLPLAIVVLGGLLATKYTLNEWEIVSSDLSYYLNKDRDKGVMNILALSYQDLPYHLKACFLYLSHLPEDRDIRAKKIGSNVDG